MKEVSKKASVESSEAKTEVKATKYKAKNKKPNGFVRFGKWIGKKFKEMWSELKKVTWPTFPKVVKQTGIVLTVVLIFLVLLTGIDFGLTRLLELITTKSKAIGG